MVAMAMVRSPGKVDGEKLTCAHLSPLADVQLLATGRSEAFSEHMKTAEEGTRGASLGAERTTGQDREGRVLLLSKVGHEQAFPCDRVTTSPTTLTVVDALPIFKTHREA